MSPIIKFLYFFLMNGAILCVLFFPLATIAINQQNTTGATNICGWEYTNGDFNWDGYQDRVLLGYADQSKNKDTAVIYYGTKHCLSATPSSWKGVCGVDGIDGDYGDSGVVVTGVGDVTGNSVDDVLIGCKGDVNRAYIYEGGRISTMPKSVISGVAEEDWQYGGYDLYNVQGLGDVNGDGYNDVSVGGAYYNENVDVYYGSSTSKGGLSSAPNFSFRLPQYGDLQKYYASSFPSTHLVHILTTRAESNYSVVGVGDTNTDGYDDVIFAWSGDYWVGNDFSTSASLLYYFLGSEDGLPNTPTQTLLWRGTAGPNRIASADINADGYADVVLDEMLDGMERISDNDTATIIFGSSNGLDFDNPLVLYAPDEETVFLGFSAGEDMNLDGIDDLLISTGEGDIVYYGETIESELQRLAGMGRVDVIGAKEARASAVSLADNKDGRVITRFLAYQDLGDVGVQVALGTFTAKNTYTLATFPTAKTTASLRLFTTDGALLDEAFVGERSRKTQWKLHTGNLIGKKTLNEMLLSRINGEDNLLLEAWASDGNGDLLQRAIAQDNDVKNKMIREGYSVMLKKKSHYSYPIWFQSLSTKTVEKWKLQKATGGTWVLQKK